MDRLVGRDGRFTGRHVSRKDGQLNEKGEGLTKKLCLGVRAR